MGDQLYRFRKLRRTIRRDDERPTGPWIWKKRWKSPVTAILASWPKSWGRGSWKNTWKRPGLTTSYDINGIKTAEGSFSYPDSGMNLAWTGIGQWEDMVNPCALMVYMGAIAGGGEAVLPNIVEPTSFLDNLKARLPVFGTTSRTKQMIDSSTASSLTEMMANNVVSHYGSENFPGLDSLCAKQVPLRWVTAKALIPGSPVSSTTHQIHMPSLFWWKTADTASMPRVL